MSPQPTPLKKPTKPPEPPFTGGMKVVITIGEVTMTIEGPVAKVIAVLRWIFGEKAEAEIARLELVFGLETPSTG